MDKYEAMTIFTRAAELLSFSNTAQDLAIPKAKVSNAIQQLEASLGTRLFHRTTRRVQLTQDGSAYYEGCLLVMEELAALESQLQNTSSISGRLRVDMNLGMAKNLVIPHLPEFLEKYPNISLEVSCVDYPVDLVREGIDCVLRVGALADSTLIAKPLGNLHIINCVSAAYLEQFGEPETLADLASHKLIDYVTSLGAKSNGWEYWDGKRYRSLAMQYRVRVNSVEAYTYACLAGLGIVQVPEVGVRRYLEEGSLVEILTSFSAEPMPVSLIYPNRKNVSKKVQVFMAWVTALMGDYLR
ncbi:LysR family transcriptional regulator [Teredinibacter haidensis]|uniref:LysR family transcriptional regulator n=1 Tax=Teredinibacter haidensis TaxID=2731755 RepID=UPI0009489A59|nr:LysR family transcriptional regulator [Teredinibacter haidensis]